MEVTCRVLCCWCSNDVHVVDKRWLSSQVLRLLGRFSISMAGPIVCCMRCSSLASILVLWKSMLLKVFWTYSARDDFVPLSLNVFNFYHYWVKRVYLSYHSLCLSFRTPLGFLVLFCFRIRLHIFDCLIYSWLCISLRLYWVYKMCL